MNKLIYAYLNTDRGAFWFEGNSLLNTQDTYIINHNNNNLFSAALYFNKMMLLAKNNDSLVESFLQVNQQAEVVEEDEITKCYYLYKLFNSGKLIVATHPSKNGYDLQFRGWLNEFITKFGGFDISAHADLLIATHKNQV